MLGAASLAALGLAVATLAKTADQAMPIAQFTFLPLSFISGVFYPLDGAPQWLVTVANIFPLKHIVDAFDAASARHAESRLVGRPRGDPSGASGCSSRPAGSAARWRTDHARADRLVRGLVDEDERAGRAVGA